MLSIAELWTMFERAALKPDKYDNAEARHAAKLLFYSGARAALEALTTDVPMTLEGVLRAQALDQEMREFGLESRAMKIVAVAAGRPRSKSTKRRKAESTK